MERKKRFFKTGGDANKTALRGGAYSLAVTAVVLAILIVINVFVSMLPASATRFDISASKLYSITSNTKVVVNNLQEDVTIYWIVQAGQEDQVIETLLSKYDSLSDHISVVKRDPDVYPAFAGEYTDETVQNNSLVVECGERSRYVGYDDIYVQEANIYSYSYSTSFDGEGAITSAIDYVTTDDLPALYTLQGHGEGELPSGFSQQVERENIDVQALSLLTSGGVPEDAACVMIYAPKSDISDREADMLSDYVSGGGKLLCIAGPTADGTLENLYGILSPYGVEPVDGVVVEPDREHYVFQNPFVLLPDMASDAATDPLIEQRYYAILPVAQGMTVSGDGAAQILTTSAEAYSKADYSADTYEREEGDTDGPFALGVRISDDSGGEIVWFSSSVFLEDMYNAYSSGANSDLCMNALSSLVGQSEAVAIRSKSLNYNYLTISESAASLLKALMIGVFPLAYLGVGIAVAVRRRRLQNETV